MTAPQKFRSALNGFNREDVVHYIEFANSRHEAEVTQLKEQLEFYRKEASVQNAAALQAEKERAAELEQKCADLEAENEALRHRRSLHELRARRARPDRGRVLRKRDGSSQKDQENHGDRLLSHQSFDRRYWH